MTHEELIAQLAQRLNQTQSETSEALEKTVASINGKLAEGHSIYIRNFGVFQTLKKTERIIVNPITEERFLVPPKIEPTFQPGAQIDTDYEESDAFTQEIFALVSEHLSKEEPVEIKKLGTFRSKSAQSSTNADTTALHFEPAEALKESVNKPFSHFETILLNEGVMLENIPVEREGVIEETCPEEEIKSVITATIADKPGIPPTDALEQEPPLPPSSPETSVCETLPTVSSVVPPPCLPSANRKRRTRQNKKHNALALIVLGGMIVAITAAAFFFQNQTENR